MAKKERVKLGIEKLLSEPPVYLAGKRVGLICNQASVDHSLRHVADLLREITACKLTTLFGAQHGVRGDVQDNMVETPHSVDPHSGLPVYSLYSEIREPTKEMLADTDVLIFDMQDVGCRIYTFIYTLANCMRAAQKFGKSLVVCDRPNPINGVHISGNVLESGHESFVGQFPLLTRHGLTIGELAQMFKKHFKIDCELEILSMDGWSRSFWLDETDAPWVMPSPNMPTLDAATVFPGTVHLEGTQMSEGRGTTKPFELIGAPYIKAEEYSKQLNDLNLPGVYFRSCYFQPTFQKYAGVTCGGVQIHVLDRLTFEPVLAGIAVVKTAYDLYQNDFEWKNTPYEYEYERNAFDVIAGTNELRKSIEGGATLADIKASWQPQIAEFDELRRSVFLYA